ncbi:AraC family transcriptional regulator [Paraglaciecola aquimarina]|uniref:AraC family transcriptional regulator n=1 Tax=Paraglaciecola aquimarina TaxID=1235557 RepID=A0ABU3STS2_9ALTE|nr:AraC family transcriptional regulator [Paraglaciecola aquimarina]MDU0353402.1 AraC family transcriptional regulator [Paraglaciecola aquimarina]
MKQHIIELETSIRIILPFAAANIYILVLVYFTLARKRIGSTYPLFAIFIVCFVIFLYSPLIKVITPKSISMIYVSIKNTLLFSVALPSLLCAVFILAKKQLSRMNIQILFSIGFVWTIYYLIYRIEVLQNNKYLFNLYQYDFFTLEGTFIGSGLYIICVVALPCVYLLSTKIEQSARITIYGVLLLTVGILMGHIFRQWEIMNLICSLTALLWCWQIFRDVRKTNQQLTHYHQHEKALAKAQFISANRHSFSQHYENKKNIDYPLREREIVFEVIRTASSGLVENKVSEFFSRLQNLCQANHQLLTLHIREALFMFVDAAIFAGANAQKLTYKLEQKGVEIEQDENAERLKALLLGECEYLCREVNYAAKQQSDEELVKGIQDYVLKNYFNNIVISEIAKAVNASQSHIMRVFKRATSQTINQYIANTRIEKAKLLLLSKSVTESAFESGFNDSNYFATVFKKQTGLTPKQYQQQAKNT